MPGPATEGLARLGVLAPLVVASPKALHFGRVELVGKDPGGAMRTEPIASAMGFGPNETSSPWREMLTSDS